MGGAPPGGNGKRLTSAIKESAATAPMQIRMSGARKHVNVGIQDNKTGMFVARLGAFLYLGHPGCRVAPGSDKSLEKEI